MEKINTEMLNKAVEGILEGQENKRIVWNGLEIFVVDTLSFQEAMTFVNNIVALGYDTSDGNFTPELKDFAIRKAIVEMYTNIELPSDVSECYKILYATDLVTVISDTINFNQMNTLILNAEEKIKYLSKSNIEIVNRQVQALMDAVEQIGETYKDVDIEELKKFIDSVEEFSNQLNNPEEKKDDE